MVGAAGAAAMGIQGASHRAGEGLGAAAGAARMARAEEGDQGVFGQVAGAALGAATDKVAEVCDSLQH